MTTIADKLRRTLPVQSVSIVERTAGILHVTFHSPDIKRLPSITLTVAYTEGHLYVSRLAVQDKKEYLFPATLRRCHLALEQLVGACSNIGASYNIELTLLVNPAICPFSRMTNFLDRRMEYNPILNKYAVYRTYRHVAVSTVLKRAVIQFLTLDLRLLKLQRRVIGA